ncbi:MAG: FAD-dependent oxidoreductase, partial [Pseudomonadota bacterium]
TDEGPCNAIDYRAEGIIGAAFSGAACDRLKRDHDALEKQGAAVRWLDADAARRHEPALAETVQGALLAPDDGQVDPPATLAALQAAFEKRGGRLLRAAKVVRLLTSQGRIEGVRLADRSELFARTVVLAAGVSAAALVPRLSRASARDRGPDGAPALFPVKGDALALAGDGLALQRTIRTEGAYICPKSDERIVIGASETPHDATLVPDDETIAALREAATGVVPGLAGLREWARWAGLRPATSDRAPIVGPDPEISGLFYALGHFRNGVLLAPLTADILADRIADGALSHWFIPFSIERFDP